MVIKEKVQAGTVEPATHLEDVLPLEISVTIVVEKLEQEESQNDWTFSLNQEEVVIQFTDSVTKVKGSHNVMFEVN